MGPGTLLLEGQSSLHLLAVCWGWDLWVKIKTPIQQIPSPGCTHFRSPHTPWRGYCSSHPKVPYRLGAAAPQTSPLKWEGLDQVGRSHGGVYPKNSIWTEGSLGALLHTPHVLLDSNKPHTTQLCSLTCFPVPSTSCHQGTNVQGCSICRA